MFFEPIMAIALFASAVTVEGRSGCPEPSLVQERLRELLPADQTEQTTDSVQLSREGGGLQITLRRMDGTLAASRTITGEHACEELAEATAVIIAAWQAGATGGERSPSPPPVGTIATLPVNISAVPAPARAHDWLLGAGLGASWSGGRLAPAAVLSLDLPWIGPIGFEARAMVSGNREVALPNGKAAWRRALMGGGFSLRRSGEHLRAQAYAIAGLSWLMIEGRGFSDGRRHDDLLGGLAGGVRIAWNRKRTQPWLELGVAVWPARSIVYQAPEGASATLPPVDVFLALGASFSR